MAPSAASRSKLESGADEEDVAVEIVVVLLLEARQHLNAEINFSFSVKEAAASALLANSTCGSCASNQKR